MAVLHAYVRTHVRTYVRTCVPVTYATWRDYDNWHTYVRTYARSLRGFEKYVRTYVRTCATLHNWHT